MARDDIQMNIRIPAQLREQLDEAARETGRSLTQEIVARLSASFPQTVEDAILKGRREELEKVRASYELAAAEHDLYIRRLNAGDTAPYGNEWMKEVVDQAGYRLIRLRSLKDYLEREVRDLSSQIEQLSGQ